jgi:hypothetical protein
MYLCAILNNKDMNSKSLNIGKTTTKITIEHDNTDDSVKVSNRIIALYILLGGYNEFGRSIDLDKYKDIKRRFNECISEIESLKK